MYRANLAGLLDGPARWAAYRPALLVGERPQRTWAGLATAVARRAGGLREGYAIAPGDLGTFDDAGRLTLVDRAKDVIITGGLPDPEWGEFVVAFLVAAPGAEVGTAALDPRCLDSIARDKRPRAYGVLAGPPRNPAGKVLKSEPRELAEAGDIAG